MKKLFSYLLVIIISTLLTNQNSFSKETSIKKNNSTIQKNFKKGDIVDGNYISSFEPPPVVGLKYTFISTSLNSNYYLPQKEETTEVINISQGYVTLLISSTFEEPFEKVVKISDIKFSGITKINFKYDGLFDIKVPFKKFIKATKVTVSNKDSDLSIWLVKGIGVVKLLEKNKIDNTIIITELKDFRKKINSDLKLNNSFY